MKRLLLSLICVCGLTLGLAGASSAQGFGLYIGNGYGGYPGGYGGYGYGGYAPRVYTGYRGPYD